MFYPPRGREVRARVAMFSFSVNRVFSKPRGRGTQWDESNKKHKSNDALLPTALTKLLEILSTLKGIFSPVYADAVEDNKTYPPTSSPPDQRVAWRSSVTELFLPLECLVALERSPDSVTKRSPGAWEIIVPRV